MQTDQRRYVPAWVCRKYVLSIVRRHLLNASRRNTATVSSTVQTIHRLKSVRTCQSFRVSRFLFGPSNAIKIKVKKRPKTTRGYLPKELTVTISEHVRSIGRSEIHRLTTETPGPLTVAERKQRKSLWKCPLPTKIATKGRQPVTTKNGLKRTVNPCFKCMLRNRREDLF